jgi:hypothetical protein
MTPINAVERSPVETADGLSGPGGWWPISTTDNVLPG